MLTDYQIQKVDRAIETVVNQFRQSPNVYLTEDDLRVHLCHQLLADFGNEAITKDHDRSISLHSEVRWYGRDGNLKMRSDIVLIDVADLIVVRYLRMPSKGYAFNIPNAIIELKLRRPNGGSDTALRTEIAHDLRKIRKLRKAVCDANGRSDCITKFWLVILDKKSQIDVRLSTEIKIRYAFARKAVNGPQINTENL